MDGRRGACSGDHVMARASIIIIIIINPCPARHVHTFFKQVLNQIKLH